MGYLNKTQMSRLALILTIIIVSCNPSKKERILDSIENNDSISFKSIENTTDFWKYSQFILKYPESDYFNLTLEKYHKTRDEYYDSVAMPIIDCFRNCATIKIKTNQQIIYEQELIKKEDLQDSLFMFFTDKSYNENRPQKKQVQDVYDNPQNITKGYVELQYVNDSCNTLQSIVKDIHYSLNTYKNYLARNWYKKDYVKLNKLENNHLDSLLENRLILFGWDEEIFIPPPPRPSSHIIYFNDTLIEEEIVEIENTIK